MTTKIENEALKEKAPQSLEDFLLSNPITLEEEVKISDRIPFKFAIKAMDNGVYTSLQQKHTKMGRTGKMSFNSMGFNVGLILECCTVPNFKDAGFVKKSGCVTPEEAVKKMLLPGEIVNLAGFIQELSGFDKDTEELKEEVKNS